MPATAKKTVRNAEEENRHSLAANCACETSPRGRKAIGVDPGLKEANQNRLRRIEGQIRGCKKWSRETAICADIITQVASVQEALRGVARNLMKIISAIVPAKALQSGKKAETEAMYDELLELIYAHLR